MPAISLRDALFHELKSQDARFPVKRSSTATTWARALLLAQMAVGLLSSAATEVTALGRRARRRGRLLRDGGRVRDRLCGRAQGEARLRGRG